MTNKKITVYTAGTYDLFHFGHLNILLRAKKLGTYLIVGISTDKLVSAYKALRPTVCYRDRVAVLKSLKCVDKVIKQSKFFDVEQLRKYKIDIIVLGSDWKGKSFPELEKVLKELKIKIIYVPYTKRLSTSTIKEKIIRNAVDIIRAQSKRR
jgi:glycerol-3-phosphate cytidylyltransferase